MFKILFLVIFCGFLGPSKGQDVQSSECCCVLNDRLKPIFENELLALLKPMNLQLPGLLGLNVVSFRFDSCDFLSFSITCEEPDMVRLDSVLTLNLKVLGNLGTLSIALKISANLSLNKRGNDLVMKYADCKVGVQVSTGLGLSLDINQLTENLMSLVKGMVQKVSALLTERCNNEILKPITELHLLEGSGSQQYSILNINIKSGAIHTFYQCEFKNANGTPVSVPNGGLPNVTLQPLNTTAVSQSVINVALQLSSIAITTIKCTKEQLVTLFGKSTESILQGDMLLTIVVSKNPEVICSAKEGAMITIRFKLTLLAMDSKTTILTGNAELSTQVELDMTNKSLCCSLSATSNIKMDFTDLDTSFSCEPCKESKNLETSLGSYLSAKLQALLKACVYVPRLQDQSPSDKKKCKPADGCCIMEDK
ncbi:uncharacterized protein LOC115096995 [Rhinatrema bivittatum]|uniref:uncharacterized protein LOC115096995 n=1 Tax=Rhinatrema bivittatum TaxID=194408 RepID=UPI0011260D23|nr:uncharacterized protein LOC115096995 [Rhinatrema bivittatum]